MKEESWQDAYKKRSQGESKGQSKGQDQPCCSYNSPLAKPIIETQNYLNSFIGRGGGDEKQNRRCLEQQALWTRF